MPNPKSKEPPHRALIAGCGYIGSRVMEFLRDRAWETTGVVHSKESAQERSDALGVPVIAGDIADAGSIAAQMSTTPDVVVHCASSGRGGVEQYRHVYQEGCASLSKAFPKAVLLFTSSTSVYPQTDGNEVTEDSPAEPDRETGQVLRAAEEIVLSRNGIVTRLSGIYGPGRSVILRKFLEGSAAIEDDGRRLLNQIHRDDAASAIVHLLELSLTKPKKSIADVRGQTFNVADNAPMSQIDTYGWLSKYFRRNLPQSVPQDLNRKRGWTHKDVSNAKLRATGWAPRYPDYQTAIMEDGDLVPSIRAQI